MNTPIKFRPHHFLCAVGYEGKGYAPGFVANFDKIIAQLRGVNGDETVITVTKHTDSICAPCPHRRDLLCESQAKIEKLDNAHAEVLQIEDGDQMTWGEAQQRIIKNLTIEKFDQICAPCEWKKLGVCETALRKLRTNE